MRAWIPFLLLTGGCSSVVEDFTTVVEDVDGVRRLDAVVAQGDLEVRGAEEPAWTVHVQQARSARAPAESGVELQIVIDTLRLRAPAMPRVTRTDVVVDGPEAFEVVADVPAGAVALSDVSGNHEVLAQYAVIHGGVGDRRVRVTRDGLEMQAMPVPGDVWELDVTGDARIVLPPQVELRLQVVLSEGARAEITGHDFDDWFATDDAIVAGRGSRAVDITVDVRRGTFFLSAP